MDDSSDAVSSSADEVISTHVLVSRATAERLRQLSSRTRIAQSEYLREAIEDLLGKYGKAPSET
jgi:predicted DNA-binding protein